MGYCQLEAAAISIVYTRYLSKLICYNILSIRYLMRQPSLGGYTRFMKVIIGVGKHHKQKDVFNILYQIARILCPAHFSHIWPNYSQTAKFGSVFLRNKYKFLGGKNPKIRTVWGTVFGLQNRSQSSIIYVFSAWILSQKMLPRRVLYVENHNTEGEHLYTV